MEITVLEPSVNLKSTKKQRQERTVQKEAQIKNVTPSGKPRLPKLPVSPKITNKLVLQASIPELGEGGIIFN